MSTSEYSSNSSINSSGVSLGVKLGYGAGDFALNLAMTGTSIFLLYYFTDVFFISASAAGFILFFARIVGAVCDPAMGYISDHTSSRLGKKRPYLLIGALPLGVTYFLMFASPSLSEPMRVVYGFVMFLLFWVAMSVINIPYSSLTAVLTQDTNERTSISGYRMIFALLGTLGAAVATMPIVRLLADQTSGFRLMGAIYGGIVVIAILITFATVKERIFDEEIYHLSIKNTVRMIFANKPFLILAVTAVLYQLAMNMLACVVNYYFKYNLGAEHMIPVAFLSMFSAAILAVPVFVYISKRKSKRYAYNLGMGIFAFVLILFFFLGDVSISVAIGLLVVAGIGMSTIFFSPWAMIPDTVEYSQWKTGVRREGILYGCFTLCGKLGGATAGIVSGFGLHLTGYIPNVTQSAATLSGIRLMMSIVPVVFIVIGMVLMSFYPIDEKMHRKMLAEINKS